MKRFVTLLGFGMCWLAAGWGQEATSGLEVGGTLSGMAAYSHELNAASGDGAPIGAGFRLMLYPVWKLSSHWSVTAAVQVHSRPYFREEFAAADDRVRADVLQANLTYSRFWRNSSLVVRAGELSTVFGAFLLRYDDARNPLIDLPAAYGYYEKPVTNLGLTGVQVDATIGKMDLRAQFVNSSPGNRRSLLDRDQYGNWAGGAGYTILQGFRVGVSAYRGPYLDHEYDSPAQERNPRNLPGTGYGLDVQWGRGAWNVYGELQRFQFVHRVAPTQNEGAGYAEIRRVLHPRWYVATRLSFVRYTGKTNDGIYETAVGYRPNRHQILKVGYEIWRGPDVRGSLSNTFTVQLVTTFHPVSITPR